MDKNYRVPQAVQHVVDAELSTLNDMLPVALAGDDIEGVHKVRVTIRRLRTALKFGKPYFEKKEIGAIRAELKTAGIIFGAVRDLDVLNQNFNSYFLQTHPGLSFPDLIWQPVFGATYQARRHQIHQGIKGQQFQNLLDQLCALPHPRSKMETDSAGQSLPQTLEEYLKPVLQRQLDHLIDQPSPLPANMPYPFFHGIRLQAKHHRYTLEFFSGILEPEGIAALIGNLILLQNHLGALNDCVVADKLLSTIPLDTLPEQTARIIEAYRAYRRAQRNNLVGSFYQVWINYLSQQPGQILQEALKHLT